MPLDKSIKRYIVLGIIFSLFAIVFFVLYHFQVIKTLDIFTVSIYISYFIGLALFYNGAYHRKQDHITATRLNFLCGTVLTLASTGMLIYGLFSGMVDLF